MADKGENFTITFDDSKKIAYVAIFEKVNLSHLMNAMVSLAEDPRFDESYSALIDMTKMDFYPDFSQFQSILDKFYELKHSYHSKVALVMVGLLKSIGDLAVKLTKKSGMELGCFFSVAKAEEWLMQDL